MHTWCIFAKIIGQNGKKKKLNFRQLEVVDQMIMIIFVPFTISYLLWFNFFNKAAIKY